MTNIWSDPPQTSLPPPPFVSSCGRWVWLLLLLSPCPPPPTVAVRQDAKPTLARSSKPNIQFVLFPPKERPDRLHAGHIFKHSERRSRRESLQSKYCWLLPTSKGSQMAATTLTGETLHYTAHKRKGLKNSRWSLSCLSFSGKTVHSLLFFSVRREVNMAHSAGAGAQLPLSAVFNINRTWFFKAFKGKFPFISWHIFHAKSSRRSRAFLNIFQATFWERQFDAAAGR